MVPLWLIDTREIPVLSIIIGKFQLHLFGRILVQLVINGSIYREIESRVMMGYTIQHARFGEHFTSALVNGSPRT